MVKVVNVISDIGHGAQIVAKPLASQWRKTVDDHIMPNVKEGLAFVGKQAAESVDVLAEAVMGAEAKRETSEALKTLQKAIMEDANATSASADFAEDAVRFLKSSLVNPFCQQQQPSYIIFDSNYLFSAFMCYLP